MKFKLEIIARFRYLNQVSHKFPWFLTTKMAMKNLVIHSTEMQALPNHKTESRHPKASLKWIETQIWTELKSSFATTKSSTVISFTASWWSLASQTAKKSANLPTTVNKPLRKSKNQFTTTTRSSTASSWWIATCPLWTVMKQPQR